MTIEKLTDEERMWLGNTDHGQRALSIIDQLIAALDAANDTFGANFDAMVEAQHQAVADRERADALQASVRELENALRIAEAREAEWERDLLAERRTVRELEAERDKDNEPKD